jgi:LmbE family N-acetylglucosaminyl deacetylase
LQPVPAVVPRRLAARWRKSLGAIALAALPVLAYAFNSLPALDMQLGPTSRLLVFAPHPDDEALGAAGLIQRVMAAGGSVRVVLMTSGDAFPEGIEMATHIRRPKPRDYVNYGNLRERETIAAMQLVGINRAHILFLGFPDGGLCLIASKYLSAKSRAFESPYTGRVEPPASEQVIHGVTYRGTDIRRELESILLAYRPTLIALPSPEDSHPDHCATSIFVRDALNEAAIGHREFAARTVQYLIHYDPWPNLDENLGLLLQPPPGFPPAEGEWRTLPLTPGEAGIKRRVIDAYPSQLLVIGRFLRAFGRPNELFLEGRPASLPECWCDDTHVATEAPPERYRRPTGPR